MHQHSNWYQVLLYTRPTIKISPLPTTRRARRRGSRAPGGTRDDETTESDIQRDCWGRIVCGKKDFRQCQCEGVADGESGESTTEKEEATGAGRKESEMQRDCDEVVFRTAVADCATLILYAELENVRMYRHADLRHTSRHTDLDLLTSVSVLTEADYIPTDLDVDTRRPRSKAVFQLERGHTNSQTQPSALYPRR